MAACTKDRFARQVCRGLPGPQTGYNPLATVDAEPRNTVATGIISTVLIFTCAGVWPPNHTASVMSSGERGGTAGFTRRYIARL